MIINLGQVVPNYIGEWNNTREYVKLDVVTYNGSSYICNATNKNTAPSTGSYYWKLLAAKGDKGDTGEDGTEWVEDELNLIDDKIAENTADIEALENTVSNHSANINNLYSQNDIQSQHITSLFSITNELKDSLSDATTGAIVDGSITSEKLANNSVTKNKLSVELQSSINNLESQILYLGNNLNSAADAYNMSAVNSIVTNCNIKIICFDTKYQKGGIIYQTIAGNYTTLYLFFEGATRASYMRTFNANTGEAIHSWKELNLFTDYEYSDGIIYGYTAGKDNVGNLTKKVKVVSLTTITDDINYMSEKVRDLESSLEKVSDSFYEQHIKESFDTTATDLHERYLDNTGIIKFPWVNMSNVTSMTSCFSGCSNLVEIPMLDTEYVVNFVACFSGCSSLVCIEAINVHSATNFKNCFSGCTSLDYLNLVGLGKAEGLTNIDLSDTKWGWYFGKQSVIDSLLNNSFNRANAGYANCEVILPARTLYGLTEEQRILITNKGYTLTAVE